MPWGIVLSEQAQDRTIILSINAFDSLDPARWWVRESVFRILTAWGLKLSSVAKTLEWRA